jgi:hypothetical protein
MNQKTGDYKRNEVNDNNSNHQFKGHVCEKKQRENVKNYISPKTQKHNSQLNNDQCKSMDTNNKNQYEEMKIYENNINARANMRCNGKREKGNNIYKHPNVRTNAHSKPSMCERTKMQEYKNTKRLNWNKNTACMLKCQQQIKEFCSLHSHDGKTAGKTVTKNNNCDVKTTNIDTSASHLKRKINTNWRSEKLSGVKTQLYKNELSLVEAKKAEEAKTLRSIKVELGKKPTVFSINWTKVVDDDLMFEYEKERLLIKVNLE